MGPGEMQELTLEEGRLRRQKTTFFAPAAMGQEILYYRGKTVL